MSVSTPTYSARNGRLDRGRSSSPFAVVATAQFESGPPASKVKYSSDDGEIFETVQEEAWEERKKKTTTTTRNIEKRVQRKLVLEDGEVVGDTGPVVTEDATEDTVTKEVISDENQRPLGQLAIAATPPGEGWVATPGAVIISEKSTKITKSHDEVEDEIETEEVQHCGDVTNREAEDHVKGQSDLRQLISHRQSKGWELAKPQKRVVYEATKKRGNVDTEDVKENSRIEDGHVVTETERTVRQEQYDNESAPDDGSSLSDGSVHEAKKETSHNLVHTKDEDLLEYYAVPKGGTLAQGVKLGEGMHVVSEDVHEDKQGDQEGEPTSDKLRKIRKPSRRDALTRKPLDYNQEEETRKCETNRWLEHHFGSESGRSESSYDGSERNHTSGGNRITITMSPTPATHEDTVDATSTPIRRWGESPTQASHTPKAPPPPPPKPTRIWNSIANNRASPEPTNRSSSRLSQDSLSHPIHDTEIAEARARLRCTGKKLIEEDKENNAPESILTNVKSSNRFQNSSTKYGSPTKIKISSMKDDIVHSSKFRSGKPKRDAPRTPDGPPPQLPSSAPPVNMGRSQSFHVQTLPWSSKKKESTFSKFKKSIKDFRSEERLDNIDKRRDSRDSRIVYDSRTIGGRIDSRPMWEQQSSWRSKSAWSPPRDPTPPPPSKKSISSIKSPTRVTIFSNSFNGREAGTQTGPSPVPPPRTKKKKRPKSSYFFGQETAACIFPNSNGSRERSFSDNSYKTSSRLSTQERNYVPAKTSPKEIRRYVTTKTITPVGFSNGNRFSDKEDYYSSVNKSSWTNTVDPRRKPRIVTEEGRSMTLPKKTRVSTISYPSKKTYVFGGSDSANDSGHENNYRGSMQNISVNHSDYNNRYTSLTDRLASKTSKPVGRSQSFNVQAGSKGGNSSYSTYNGQTLADLSGHRSSSTYGSSPYLNLRSPNLISTIARTSSTRRNYEEETVNEADQDKKDRFMKGLLNTAPELFHFIHGSEEDQTDNGVQSNAQENSHHRKISPPSQKHSAFAPSSSVKSPSSSYSAKVFTFGKGENNTLIRTSSQGNDSGFSNSYNSMEDNNKKYSENNKQSNEKNKRYSYDSSTLENNKKNVLINNHNRRSNFNLKTSGGSLLHSPAFRNDSEDRRLSRTSSGEKEGSNRLSGDFNGKGHLSTNVREGSPVLIQVRDWDTR